MSFPNSFYPSVCVWGVGGGGGGGGGGRGVAASDE